MKAIIVLSVIVCATIVHATSNADPNIIFLCDAMSSRWGCDPQFWPAGNRLKCMNASTQLMPWATKAKRSPCYQMLAGEESNPTTSYTPGEYTQIHIRVTCYKMQYRGIMFYAVDANENKVGDWEFPENEPALFSKPWATQTTNPCQKTNMHFSAEWKPYHASVFFKGPPAGTGPIKFRALFKHGNANTGDFFWPQVDLTLSEGPAKERETEWIAVPDKTCQTACMEKGLDCNEEALQSLNGEQAVKDILGSNYVCQIAVSGCGEDGGIIDQENDYCYYVDPNCPAQNRTASTVNCKSDNVGITRMCPCGGEDSMSPAATQRPAILGLLLLIPLFFMGNINNRLIFGILLVTGMSFAHNWVNSLSRSPSASTYQPCKPPVTDLPHAEVGPGQAFQIEWMTAHGDFAYFAIIHSRDADKLKLHTPTVLNDYIKRAPNGTNQAMKSNLQKFHRKDTPTLDNDVTDNMIPDFFAEVIYPNNTDYIFRPAVFEGRVGNIGTPKPNQIYQMRYKPASIAEDVRVSYRSDLYPWIEAVYKFKQVTLAAVRPDTANFFIPGFGGAGRYIVQYYWRGYRDCTDVDYKPTVQVAQIYGIPFNGTRWTKIDHCLFENVRRVFTSSQVFDNPSYCLDLCRTGDCYGVNVVPLIAPTTAYQGFKPDANDMWMYPNNYGSDIYIPWNATAFNITRFAYMTNPAATKYICYAVTPAEFTDTTDEYTISNDPEDPIFYSTCFYRFRGNLFEDYATKASPDEIVPWRFYDKCIDCKSQSSNRNPLTVPKWPITDKCINCDYEPSQPDPVNVLLVEGGVRCDGMNNQWSNTAHTTCPNTTNCYKQMKILGRNLLTMPFSECQSLVASDPECISTFVYRNTSNCYCYAKAACCKTCSRRVDPSYAVYQLAATPDPTCATGTKSTDGTKCCSKECGAGNCNTVATNQDPVGFCYATGITRPCAKFGPPCQL